MDHGQWLSGQGLQIKDAVIAIIEDVALLCLRVPPQMSAHLRNERGSPRCCHLSNDPGTESSWLSPLSPAFYSSKHPYGATALARIMHQDKQLC